MTFVLSSENVLDYLVGLELLTHQDSLLANITPQEYRNFNLLVSAATGNCLLVKQARLQPNRADGCEFWREQAIYSLFQAFPELQQLCSLTSEVVYFDPENLIIVLRYFSDYSNLSQFYTNHQHQFFPTEIATSLGSALAIVHGQTWGKEMQQSYLIGSEISRLRIAKPPSFLQGLERFSPNIFSYISTDGLDFWRFYQRSESLHQAVVAIAESYQTNCLIHSDLEFRNILVRTSDFDPDLYKDVDIINAHGVNQSNLWFETSAIKANGIKLIDWEFFRWGDPAYDLGIVLSCYLNLWLDSLMVSKTIPIQMALQLATIPLELLQPSMTALIQSYLGQFLEILEWQPNFIQRLLQFTGLVLVKQIQSKMEHLYPFDNGCICALQVAKMLLCHPEQSCLELFGVSATTLAQREVVLAC